MSMDAEELSLIEGLRARRPVSLEQVIAKYAPRLLSTAARIGNPDDAEDVVQESLLAAWQSIQQFEGSSSLYTWLHRIVVNRCLARMRTAASKQESRSDAAAALERTLPPWSEPAISLGNQVAMRRTIEAALRQLPEEWRVVLLLRDVEELSSKEAADQLGISDALVRQRLHRARTTMAEILRPELCEGRELTCGGQIDLLFDHLDGCLAAALRAPVGQHVEECVTCNSLAEAYRKTIGVPRLGLSLAFGRFSEGFVSNTARRLLEAV